MNRFSYAAGAYFYCLQKYGLTMSEEQVKQVSERFAYLQAISSDPLGAAADRMGHVRSRLDELDSGRETREKQKEIAAILEDLIKSAEEMQNSGGGGQGSQQAGGKQQGQKQSSGDSAGRPKGQGAGGRAGGRPSSPAQRGFLPPGIAQRPKESAKVRPAEGGDDWAKLPGSKREEIDSAAQRLLPEYYRKLVEEYRKELSRPASGSEE